MSLDRSHISDDGDINVGPLESQNQTWCISDYLPKENASGYDERHALSQALESWIYDCVSDPKVPLTFPIP